MKMYPIEAATVSRDLDCEYSLSPSSEMQADLPAALLAPAYTPGAERQGELPSRPDSLPSCQRWRR